METVWTIAASDSSGGAGIERDLAVIRDFNLNACSVITALTDQTSEKVNYVLPTKTLFLENNLYNLAVDMQPTAIKIGLIPNVEILDVINNFIIQLRQLNSSLFVVMDPVNISSTGQEMSFLSIDQDAIHKIYPNIDLLTPNLLELQLLSKSKNIAKTLVEVLQQGKILQQQGVKNILIKGGHGLDPLYVFDVLLTIDEYFIYRSPRNDSNNKHGTGCTLSSAIASVMAKQHKLYDAITIAQTYVNKAIKNGFSCGIGHGTLGFNVNYNDVDCLPQIVRTFDDTVVTYNFEKENQKMGLYPVVPTVDWVEKLLKMGVKTIQLRIKDPNYIDLEKDIEKAVKLGKEYSARVYIDDYWKLAIKYGAYGVHLGQEDLLTADLKSIEQSGVHLGLSTHGYYEIARAYQVKPSYIALGHIFPTKTKKMKSNPQGLINLRSYAKLLNNYPLVAIGGIKLDTIKDVKKTGVGSIAVVTAITESNDPKTVVNEMLSLLS